ncbi:MAG: hypothetical protein IIC03_14055 [Proteobacteria bacterium]|nr:hypothetical protein [Pseudomonadota bacterium]
MPGCHAARPAAYPPGPFRAVSGSQVASSGQATSTATLYQQLVSAGEMAQRTPAGPTFLSVPIETMLNEWVPPANMRDAPPAPKPRPALADIAAGGGSTLLIVHRALMRVILARAWGWNYDSKEPFRIKRGRLYPLTLLADGTPTEPEEPARLEPIA